MATTPRPTSTSNDPRYTDSLNPTAPAGLDPLAVDSRRAANSQDPRIDNRTVVQSRGAGNGILIAVVLLALALIAYFVFGRGNDEAVVETPAATDAAPVVTTPAAPADAAAPATTTDTAAPATTDTAAPAATDSATPAPADSATPAPADSAAPADTTAPASNDTAAPLDSTTAPAPDAAAPATPAPDAMAPAAPADPATPAPAQ